MTQRLREDALLVRNGRNKAVTGDDSQDDTGQPRHLSKHRRGGDRSFPRLVAIVLRCAPGLGTSTRRRCRSGDASAPTAVIPAALAATVAITQQSKR